MWIYAGDLADMLAEFEMPGPDAPETVRFELFGSSHHPWRCRRTVEFHLEKQPGGQWAYVAACTLVVTGMDVALNAEFLPCADDDVEERREQLERLEVCRGMLLGLSPALGGR
jgi:hypothetical protein